MSAQKNLTKSRKGQTETPGEHETKVRKSQTESQGEHEPLNKADLIELLENSQEKLEKKNSCKYSQSDRNKL